ncbi:MULTISPECIES: 4Fe-4S dicluster domain-containing protein [unclassified Candidatus Frackibacter]|uniref:4Fe-4S dicluster domain-containing protein n=1 Tax=unclassified Candidatus Frackibacter TaxID=2648818 RepID=UPI00088B5F00|nr:MULTISPECIES: 4Fe-4S dicluster domain-containing protein [unclassified Candidatus Frackibacter]SDC26483.1 4Fe-4S dicluster domain-containing protein [Candidatus Frackibacter sp. WG11]SEM53508.1 4Fe-4S dicluster domain-containing protein [Candidatus Frackibacter sp. WG12]SFL54999.1 4Fe-4S dicluster domain-containing protein [Candidatus Frackibacter sp. WG13]
MKKKAFNKAGEEYTLNYSEDVDWNKCIGCGNCVRICGQDVYILVNTPQGQKADNPNSNRCLGDAHCYSACPTQAIEFKSANQND